MLLEIFLMLLNLSGIRKRDLLLPFKGAQFGNIFLELVPHTKKTLLMIKSFEAAHCEHV
jgi:hypothetical protein